MAGLAAAFGSGAMTNSIDEIENANCIFVIGSNTTEAHPLVARRIFRAKQKGAFLIVADPRRIQLAHYADIYIRQRPGTDVALLNGMMNVIISQGWEAKDYIKERTEGFEEFKKTIEKYPLDKVSSITGVPQDKIKEAAKAYATSKASTIIYAMGITQHISGVDNVKSLANLAMLCGKVGIESGGVNPLRGQNNVQGACDMGALPNVYPGYQRVDNEDVAKKFEDAWGVKLSRKPGLTLMEMMDAIIDGKVKALYIMGENPLLSDPNSRHLEEALRKVEFLLVQDIFLTETARYAHVVLPGVSFVEKDGIFTNTERRAQRVRKAIEPVGDSKPDWEIICLLSEKMGYPMKYSSPEEIQKEIASLTPSYAGIVYERIEKEGLQWPCPALDHPGTKFLHKDKFARGKGLFHKVEYKPPAEVPDDTYPFSLTTGRTFVHYHTGTMTRRSPSLHSEMEDAYVEINPDDAKELGIVQGETIKVTSRRGEISLKAKFTNKVDKKSLFIPFHFAEAAANVLTNDALDPIAKIPEYKICAVKVEKIESKKESS